MRTVIAAFALLTAATASTVFPETPSQSQSVEPTFEVVSIKPSTAVMALVPAWSRDRTVDSGGRIFRRVRSSRARTRPRFPPTSWGFPPGR
jgi:hypothetical protein